MSRKTPIEVVIDATESLVFGARNKYLEEVDELSRLFYEAFYDKISNEVAEDKEAFMEVINAYYSSKFVVTTGFVKYTVDDNIPILIGTIIENAGDESSYASTFQSTSFKTSHSFEIILRSSLFSLYDSIRSFLKNADFDTHAETVQTRVPRFIGNSVLNRVRNNKGIDTPLDELYGISLELVQNLHLSKRVRSLVGPSYRWEDDLLIHNHHFNAIIRV